MIPRDPEDDPPEDAPKPQTEPEPEEQELPLAAKRVAEGSNLWVKERVREAKNLQAQLDAEAERLERLERAQPRGGVGFVADYDLFENI